MLEIELALAKPVGISKKNCLLDVAVVSHGLCGVDATMTHTARVLTFDNPDDDSSPDVRKTPSPKKAGEKRTSPPPSMSGYFCMLASPCLAWALMTIFVGAIQPLPLENLDEDLEVCLERVSFVYLHFFLLLCSV
jgi:hypothetical protein